MIRNIICSIYESNSPLGIIAANILPRDNVTQFFFFNSGEHEMQLDRKRHCHTSSWTFALRNFIFDRVGGVVRVIVIVVFDEELFWIRSCRVVEHLSGSASRVDFEIHCFEVPFSCRGFYGMIMSKCNSEAVQNYAQVLRVHATIDFHGVLCGHCNVMTPCWVGFFLFFPL